VRVLFWGTPAYAVPSLQALVDAGHELVGVVSQPDRRRGRGSALLASPVKARALELGLPVFTPERIRREPELQAQLAALGADLSVVVAFGQILPTAVLEQPPLGCWNGHGSLLPRWRGAAPIQWSLIEGDLETGVGIMAMEEGLDTGPVLLERRLAIDPLENADGLARRLSQLTAELLVEAMPLIERAGPGPLAERLVRLGVRRQPEQADRYARLLAKQDYRINWAEPALAVHRRVMGLYPGAHTSWGGQRLKLLSTEPATHPGTGSEPPGTVVEVRPNDGLLVATGEGALVIREAQLQGKGAARGQGLIQQLGAQRGDQLGDPHAGPGGPT
jgi:methionyl-tRNA formyltransferase